MMKKMVPNRTNLVTGTVYESHILHRNKVRSLSSKPSASNLTYEGTITSIKDFGLFVKVFSKEGLCHISEVSNTRVNNLSESFKEGDKLKVKVLDINDRGQVKLSHKATL